MNYLQKKKLAFMSIVNSVKGFVRTVIGIPPLALPYCADEKSFMNYKIYGNSVQDGTPLPDNPVEFVRVGEYDEGTGKFKIPIVAKGEQGQEITTNIYLDRPLYRIADCADYIDFENSKVVRNIEYTGLSEYFSWRTIAAWNTANTYYFDCINQVHNIKELTAFETPKALCNMFSVTNNNVWGKSDDTVNRFSVNAANKQFRCRVSKDIATTVDEFKNFITNNNIALAYQMETPKEESIELPTLPTFKGVTIYEIDTSIQPSNMEVTYYSTRKGD